CISRATCRRGPSPTSGSPLPTPTTWLVSSRACRCPRDGETAGGAGRPHGFGQDRRLAEAGRGAGRRDRVYRFDGPVSRDGHRDGEAVGGGTDPGAPPHDRPDRPQRIVLRGPVPGGGEPCPF